MAKAPSLKKIAGPKSVKKTAAKAVSVSFSFYAPEAQRIAVGGDFNDWSHAKHKLKKGKDGTWTTTIKLKPGRYEYLFRINDTHWEPDQNPQETVPNDFGTRNCVKIVA